MGGSEVKKEKKKKVFERGNNKILMLKFLLFQQTIARIQRIFNFFTR